MEWPNVSDRIAGIHPLTKPKLMPSLSSWDEAARGAFPALKPPMCSTLLGLGRDASCGKAQTRSHRRLPRPTLHSTDLPAHHGTRANGSTNVISGASTISSQQFREVAPFLSPNRDSQTCGFAAPFSVLQHLEFSGWPANPPDLVACKSTVHGSISESARLLGLHLDATTREAIAPFCFFAFRFYSPTQFASIDSTLTTLEVIAPIFFPAARQAAHLCAC